MHALITPGPPITHLSALSAALICLCCLVTMLDESLALAQKLTPTAVPSSGSNIAPASNVITEQTRTSLASSGPGGFSLFMGASAGPLFSHSSSPGESNKTGFMIAGKGIASLYSNLWVIDGGVGWLSAQLNSSEARKDEYPKITPGSEGEFRPGPVKLIVNAGLIEFALRYRLSKDWQIGTIGNALLSNGDTAFSAITSRDSAPARFTGLAGAQIAFGTQNRESDWRFGIAYLTDVTIAERKIQLIAASLELGIPIVNPERIVEEREIVTQKQKINLVTKEKLENKVMFKQVLRLVFEANEVLFVDSGTKLHPDSLTLLKEIGKLAAAKDSAWTEVEIDPQLSKSLPSEQSRRARESRVAAVRAALRLGGLDVRKISMRSLSSSAPDETLPERTAEAAANGGDRLVVNFSGAQADPVFLEKVRQLRKLYRIPSTCIVEQGCK